MEAAPRAARKVITALFADVVGSTALGERLDPEELQEIVGEGVAQIVRAAEELGGHVERIAGDGALILFGAPVAHEDDAERAVLAGLRVLAAIDAYAAELARTHELDGFAVRVGVETGTAVLAALGGARPIEFGATGDVLNTAARLEAAAEPGTMLVGPHTFEVVEAGFDWDPPRKLTLKGKADVVVGHRPRWPRGPGYGRRGAGRVTPLLGRERELASLDAGLARLHEGPGGVLVLTGEPGLGKTRLLSELRRRAEAATPTPVWLEGRCVSYGQRLPYLPFQALLRNWLGATPADDEARVASLLDARLAALMGERSAQVRPFVGTVLGIPARSADAARMSGLGAEDLQAATFSAVISLIRELARNSSVVLALDDVHWADGTSLALAQALVSSLDECRVLLVVAARPGGEAPLRDHAIEALGDRTTVLELDPLPGQADRALLTELAGGAELPEELGQRVLDRAEGNPLYLEEVVRSLMDAGALVRDGDGWRYDRNVEVQVPETVEKLVLARVDVLSPVARELLSAAAVLGRRFTRPLLAEVAGDAAALPELLEAELVLEADLGSPGEYRFKHHLIREVTYGSMLKRRRQELHRRAAAAIESLLADGIEEQLGVLALHWEAAGDLERALDFHARAAHAAELLGASDEALDHYAAALGAGEALGLPSDDPRLSAIAMQRAEILFYTGDPEQGAAEANRALEGARRTANRSLELAALTQLALQRYGGYEHAVALGEEAVTIARSLGDGPALAGALSRLAILDANRLHLERSLEEASEAVELARRLDDEEVTGLAVDGLKLSHLKLGRLDDVERATAELIEIHRRRENLFYLEWALLESSFPMLGRGDFAAARARAREALELNQRLGDRANEALFHDGLCWLERACGNHERALEHGRHAVACATERGSGEWLGWTSATLGWVLLELEAAAEAAPVLEAGARAAQEVQAVGEVLRCRGLLAWALWLQGDADAATSLAGETEARLAEVRAPAGEAWLFGAHAQLAVARTLLAAGEPERAAALARPLLAAARRNRWLDAADAAAEVLAPAERALGSRATSR